MAPESPIEVRIGESRWLRSGRLALFLLAALSLGVAPIDTVWKFAALVGLLLTLVLVTLHLRRISRTHTLRLIPPDLVTLTGTGRTEIHGTLGPAHWATGPVSVVTVVPLDSRRPLRLIVCRSRNQATDYRRLLARLRLGSGQRNKNGILNQA